MTSGRDWIEFLGVVFAAAALLSWAALASPTAAQDAPTVVMVHGYDFGTGATAGTVCASGFNDLANALRAAPDARTPHDVRLVGYYAGDGWTCTDSLPTSYSDIPNLGTRDESIRDIARRFADWVYASYVSQGRTVDIIGHSMGGLIVRYALTFYADRFVVDGRSYVDDVITGGAPYGAITKQSLDTCRAQAQLRNTSRLTQQCSEMGGMDGNGGVKAELLGRPLPAFATWSLLGSDHDDGVPSASATEPNGPFFYEYKQVFAREQNVTHSDYFTNSVLWLQPNPAMGYAQNALTAPK